MPVYHRLISSKGDPFPDNIENTLSFNNSSMGNLSKYSMLFFWRIQPQLYLKLYFFKQTNKWKTHQMFSVNRDRRPITDEGGHPLKPVIVCEHNLIFTLLSFPMIVLCLYRIPKGLLSAQMRVSPSCKGSKCNVPLSSGKWTAWKAKTRTFCCGINSHSNGLENTQYA